MSHNETSRTIIHALVPASPADSERVVVNWRGTLPQAEHTPGSGTFEDTLNSIGQAALGLNFLSVRNRDFAREAEYADSVDHHIIYASKISASDVELPKTIRLDKPRIKPQNALAAAARHLMLLTKETAINAYYDATIYGNYLPRR
jgi:hypothetical protein